MLVVCCGMQRSGSTVQYQIASAVAETLGIGRGVGWDWSSASENMASGERPVHVVKVHQPNPAFEAKLNPACTRYIYCHRDIRDVIVSLLDKYGPMDDAKIEHHVREFAITPFEHFSRRPGVLISRYDDLCEDLGSEVARIAHIMNATLDAAECATIAQRFALEEQRSYIRGRDWSDGREWDSASLLHHNHITDARTGKWKDRLAPGQVQVIERIAGDWLRANGYEI